MSRDPQAQVNSKSGNVVCDNIRVREDIILSGDIRGYNDRAIEINGDIHITGNLCVDGGINEGCSETYDYIIVGDGTAGSIMARKLSDPITKNGKLYHPKVLILEMGSNHIQQLGYPTNPTVLDAAVLQPGAYADPNSTINQLINNPKYSKLYQCAVNNTTVDPVLSGRPPFSFSVGKGWGGGSTHFLMIAYRGTSSNWNDYAAITGDSSWSYNSLLPIFKNLETYTPNTGGCFDATQRGSHGPISLVQQAADEFVNPSSVTCDPVVKLFAEDPTVGVGYTCDYNSGSEPAVGVASLQLYQTAPVKNGYGQYRSWAHNSFLPIGTVINTYGEGLNGRKLKLVSNATANKVIFEGTKAVGVDYVDTITGNNVQVFGDQIILSSGVFQNPAILQRSGLGDATLLNSLNIPVIVNNPNIGSGMEQSGGPFMILGTPFTILAVESSSDLHNTTQNPGDPFYYPNDGIRRAKQLMLDGILFFGVTGTTLIGPELLRTNWNGTVKIVSTNPLADPEINLNMFSDDTTGLVNGSGLNQLMANMYNIKTVADANAFPLVGIPGVSPSAADFATTTDLANFIKLASTPQSHQSGTCRFGTSAATAVVDSNFNVFGVQNLKVADLSVYPYTIDGNPMYSAMIAGLKCVTTLGVSLDPIL